MTAGAYAKFFKKALNDPKYAEYKRREIVESARENVQIVGQLKNIVTTLKKDIKENDSELQTLGKRLAALDTNNDNVVDNPANSSEFSTKTAAYKKAQAERDLLKKDLRSTEQSLERETSKLNNQKLVLAKLDEITGTTSNLLIKGSGGGNGGKSDDRSDGNKSNKRFKFTYNAPMVKSAYFNAGSIQANSTKDGSNKVFPPNLKSKDALDAAFQSTGTRGLIQMSTETATWLKARYKEKGGKFDPTPYGFRFHYNPTSIEMNYGYIQDVSPEALIEEVQKFNAITPLGTGRLSFTLYLNRIGDMLYLTKDGSLIDPQTGDALAPTTVYSEEVPVADRKQIYKKGTMYDLEYLFKSVHSGSSDYNSLLRGKTSDVGWLVGVACEVHLGDGLRYLVRIDGLSVNHAMFNERMVPTLTTVSLTASRFYDFPIKNVPKRSGGGGGAQEPR